MIHHSQDHESYDFVIVGAGPSAMGLLYGLLETFSFQNCKPPFSLCVLDQGGDLHETITRDPKDWYIASHARSSKSVYQIPSIITGRVIDLPIGKGLGGTSNINASLCTPPLARDLKSWPSPWDRNLLGYVQEIQSALRENGALQGAKASGRYQSSFPFKEKSFLDMMPGVPTLATKTNDDQLKLEYVRRNYFDGLVDPLLKKNPHWQESVTFRFEAQVQRLLIDETISTAKGLIYSSRDGELHTVHGRKGVILCGGAIESPVLLQVSGVTAGGQVGLHLKDQILIPRIFVTTMRESEKPKTVNGIQALGHWKDTRDILQVAILETPAIQPIAPSTVAMAVRRNCNGLFPWKQVFEFSYLALKKLISWTLWFFPVRLFLESYTVTTLLFLMHPVSEGSIRIRPKDTGKPLDELIRKQVDVVVNCGYLQEEKDIESLRHCWNSLARDRRAYELFPRYLFQPLSWIALCWDWFPAFCRLFSQPYYHFCSSCRMKTKDTNDWVVDRNLSVRSHSKLRICDASVFPDTISSPPALTCAALGYGLGKLLLAEHKKTVPVSIKIRPFSNATT